MPNTRKYLGLFFVFLVVLSTQSALAQTCADVGDKAVINSIREQRNTFNSAIVQYDIGAIHSVLHENVILITGTDSDVFLGREAQLALWRADFENADRATYVRTSLCLRVSPIAPIALEHGAWRGVRNNNADAYAAGHYTAKWRQFEGTWLIESEIFATEECGGDFCPRQKNSE